MNNEHKNLQPQPLEHAPRRSSTGRRAYWASGSGTTATTPIATDVRCSARRNAQRCLIATLQRQRQPDIPGQPGRQDTLGTFDENSPSFAEGSEPEVLTEALSETGLDDPEVFDDEDNFLWNRTSPKHPVVVESPAGCQRQLRRPPAGDSIFVSIRARSDCL